MTGASGPDFRTEETITGRRLVDRVRGALKRIQAENQALHAFITVTADRALAEAVGWDAAGDTERAAAPLLGTTLAVKDLIDVAGVPTTGGSRVLFDNVPTKDAPVVARLARAGAITLGKANLHEFAYGTTGENAYFGTCANVYDPGRLACGSSSGSAVAVAAGLADAALGTDTGGSVRVPAVLNGLVGLKPTFGLLPGAGTIPFSWSLDHIGLIAGHVEHMAALLAAFSVPLPSRVPGGLARPDHLAGVKIGVSALDGDDLSQGVRAANGRVLAYLRAHGAIVEEVALPDLALARTVSLTIQMPEALSYHSSHLARRGELYGDDLRAGLALGQFILAEHYLRAKRLAVGLRREIDRLFDTVDVLVTPATPMAAPRIGTALVRLGSREEAVGNALTRYTSLFNLTGHPALALPSGLDEDGLPVGVQLVGRHFEEADLLALARLIESEPEFRIPPPPVSVTR